MTAVALWSAAPRDFDGDDAIARLEAVLTPDEAARYRAFLRRENRIEYLVTRGLAHAAIAAHLGVAEGSVRFVRSPHGRPEVVPDARPSFNLANHPSLVVCAVVEGAEVGVDVEPLDRGDAILEVARDAFAPAEQAALFALPTALRRERAVVLWTLKEAYIKARGLGLSLPLDAFAFDFVSGSGPSIAFDDRIADTAHSWRFTTRIVDGHRVSLAVRAAAIEVCPRRWSPRDLASWPPR